MFRSLIAFVALCATAGAAAAQPFGTFVWQTQPFCNRLTLALTAAPGGFTVIGTDDACGAPRKSSVTGTIVLNADATASLHLTVAPSDDGRSVELSATVSTADGSGAWSDAFGQSGAFALGGAMTALPVRPMSAMPIDIADNPRGTADPCSEAGGRQELVLCGTSGLYWTHENDRLQVWRDGDGRVHVRGSLYRNAGVGSGMLVVLPPQLRPSRSRTFHAVASDGSKPVAPVLISVVGPDQPSFAGVVFVSSSSTNRELHLGEIVFTIDR